MIHQTPILGLEELSALGRIEDLRRELRFRTAEPKRWIGSVRRVLAARAIQGSNSIEGYNVSVEDAVAAVEGDTPTEAGNEDWNAVVGYRRAMTYVLRLAQDPHFEYSAQLIRSLHFMMTETTLEAGPGLWRPSAVWIRNDATDEIVYEGPDPILVPGMIEELVAQLTGNAEVPGMVRGAMAHLNLVMIHPFHDGNGRMARCLQTLALAREQVLAAELISIEEYLGRNTRAYYAVLGTVGQGTWNPSRDARPWFRFCLEAHYVQAMSVLRRLREADQIWEECVGWVQNGRLPVRSTVALFDAAIGLRIRNSSYRLALKRQDETVSEQVATSDLSAMVQAGLLLRQGAKRGTTYVAAPPLVEITERARGARLPLDAFGLFTPPDQPPLEPAKSGEPWPLDARATTRP